jgi:hypothetical protein
MLTDAQKRQIVDRIYAQPSLYGCQIGYEGNNQSSVIHHGMVPSVNYHRVLVIIEETTEGPPSQVVVRGGSSAGPPSLPPAPAVTQTPPNFVSNGSRLWPELIGAGASCALTVVSGVAVAGGVAAEVPSAGTSTALVVLGWAGLVTSSLQCGNGLARSYDALMNPDDNSIQRAESNVWYSRGFLVVDAIGVVSSLAALPSAMRGLYTLLQRRGGLVSVEALSRMNRAERQIAVARALERAASNPAERAALEAALRQAGMTEAQMARLASRGAVASVAGSRTVMTVIDQATARALSESIRDVVSGVAGIGLSATPARWTGSGSGAARALIVHVVGIQED